MTSNGFRDYYKILQVHYDASPEVIRGAYKNLSKSYHPDSGRADSDHMALLNEAYAILSNAASRKVLALAVIVASVGIYHGIGIGKALSHRMMVGNNKINSSMPPSPPMYIKRTIRLLYSLNLRYLPQPKLWKPSSIISSSKAAAKPIACGNTVATPALATPCKASFHQLYCSIPSSGIAGLS